MTNLVLWRDKVKKAFEQREGEKAHLHPASSRPSCRPSRNADGERQVDGCSIIRKEGHQHRHGRRALPRNLIVPVIRRADQLNLVGLARQVNDLAAGTGRWLQPDEIQEAPIP